MDRYFAHLRVQRGVSYEKGKETFASSKLICGYCEKFIYGSDNLNPYFRCLSQYDNPKGNSVHKVKGMFLEQYVLFEMQ